MKKQIYYFFIISILLYQQTYSQHFNGIVIYKTEIIPKEDCQLLKPAPPEYDTVFFGSNRAMCRKNVTADSPSKDLSVYDYVENKHYMYYEVFGKTYLIIQNDSTIQAENNAYLTKNKVDTLSRNVYRVISKMDTVIYEISQEYNIPCHPMYPYFKGLPIKYTLSLPRSFCTYDYTYHSHSEFSFFSMDLFPELKKVDKVYENISLKKFMEEYMFR